ncbi:nucleotidyltransferase family protein [Chloroflexota bacterium]
MKVNKRLLPAQKEKHTQGKRSIPTCNRTNFTGEVIQNSLHRTIADITSRGEQSCSRIEVSLSRENALLVHCARLDLFQGRRQAVRDILDEGLDWDLLLDRAAWHRLLPLVSYHLRSPDLSVFVPRLMLEKLQRLSYQSLARNMLLQEELSKLLSALNEEGIPVIVLKGAALLGSIYDDIGLRPMSDLDILVQPEHLDCAAAIASCQGYVPMTAGDAQERTTTTNRHHSPHLRQFEKGILLEIHQHIVDSDSAYHFDLSGFWARAQLVTISGAGALMLSPEDLLIHLSAHFLFHRCYSSISALGQLCDISEVIFQYGDSMNWNLIEEFSQDGIAPGLHCVFYACEQLLGSQVPVSVLARLQPLEFNPSLVKLFLSRRVLDTRPWLAHQLVAPSSAYTLPRAIRAALGRLLTMPGRFSGKYGFRKYYNRLYLKRLTGILRRFGGALLRPSELKEDLLLDRWLHDLGSSTTQIGPHDSQPRPGR